MYHLGNRYISVPAFRTSFKNISRKSGRYMMFQNIKKTNFLEALHFKQYRHPKSPVCFNELFFDNGIYSKSHAWLLGWAYGDGSVTSDKCHRFQMRLQVQDVDVLSQINTILDSEYHIGVGWNGLPGRPSVGISINNYHFVSSLERLGCFPRKCNAIAFPFNVVPDELLWHFVRGYFEADGTISMQKNGMTEIKFQASCEEFLRDLNHFIMNSANVTPKSVTIKKTNNNYLPVSQMGWSKREDIQAIVDMMYSNSFTSMQTNETNLHYCHRKYHRCKIIQSVLHIPLNQRNTAYMKHKIDEMKRELYILCLLIEANAKGIQNQSRIFEQYNFANSWIKLLKRIVLQQDGTLHDYWQLRLKRWLSTRKHNEILQTVPDDEVFDKYYEWKDAFYV